MMSPMSDFGTSALAPMSTFGALGTFGPTCDMRWSGDDYKVDVSLPGWNKDDVKVDITGLVSLSSIQSFKSRFDTRTCLGDTVTMKGERKESKDSSDSQWVRRESRSSNFTRSFQALTLFCFSLPALHAPSTAHCDPPQLPLDADPDNVKANFQNGVLSLDFHAKPDAGRKTKAITIE